MTLTLTLKDGGHRNCWSYASWYFVRVPSANFRDTMTIRFKFMAVGHWANTLRLFTWPCDLKLYYYYYY